MTKQKIYCYVDESGQETKGRIFVVSVVLIEKQKEEIFTLCEELEKVSGKGKHKWGEATHSERMRYLQNIFADDRFSGMLRFETFQKTTNYDLATVTAITSAVRWKKPREPYTSIIYVDGLTKTKRREYGARLRHFGLSVHKIQGVAKDESNALTRLADALAGFIHDALDGHSKEISSMFHKAQKKGVLIDVST